MNASLTGISNTEDNNNAIAIDIFPNPASDRINLAINLEEVSETVGVRIVSLDGKIITDDVFNNVQRDQLSVDVSNIAAGNYLMMIRTDIGLKTQKVTIVK